MNRYTCLMCIASMALGTTALAQSNGIQINTDNNGSNIPNDAANEPSFAISPIDPNIIVAGWRQFDKISSDVRYAGCAYSFDGGFTWTNRDTLDLPPGSGSGANQSDPVLAVDREGAFFYNSLIFRSLRNGICTYRSMDDGVNWDTPVYVYESGADKNWYIIDNTENSDNHYAIWQMPGHFARSIDGGQSYQPSFDIGASIFAHLNVGPSGEVYAAWWSSDHVTIRRSDNAWDPNVNPIFGIT